MQIGIDKTFQFVDLAFLKQPFLAAPLLKEPRQLISRLRAFRVVA